jgi:hypothetical protein
MTWGQVYALFVLETGWSWEYIDEEMTMPRANEFVDLWKLTPPLRVTLSIIAHALGMESPESTGAAPKGKKQDLGSYLEAFGSAGLQVERIGKHG